MTKQILTRQEKKKALAEWLNSPITTLYIQFLKKHSEELKDSIFEISKFNFIGSNILTRSPEEISYHTRLVAIDLVLSDLRPLIAFKDKCNQEEWDMLDIAETYEEDILGEKLRHQNPLDLFINQL